MLKRQSALSLPQNKAKNKKLKARDMRKLFSAFLDILFKVLRVKPAIRLLKKHKALIIGLFIVLAFALAAWLKTVDLSEILSYKKSLLSAAQDHPLASSLAFFLIYFLVASLSLPGAAFFSLSGGFLFGFAKGAALSIFAISLGSSAAFLLTRFFARDFLIKKGGRKLEKIYNKLKKDEIYYLFALRLLPFIPLFFTNMIMGLSSIRLSAFFVVSFVSFLPLLAVYTNMGAQLSQLEGLRGLTAPNLLFAGALAGLFPLFARQALRFVKKLKKTEGPLPLESESAFFSPLKNNFLKFKRKGGL